MYEEVDPSTRLIHHFSSWICLKKTVAWVLRLKGLLLFPSRMRKQVSDVIAQLHLDPSQKVTGKHETQGNGCLTVKKLVNAEMEVICFGQKKRSAEEI